LTTYGKEDNVAWHVWSADFDEDQDGVKKYSSQRFDIESIIDVVRVSPDSIHRISIGWNSLQQNDFADMMKRKH